MYWANFLHIYQPPTQTEHIVRKVTSECYRTLVKVLDESPRAKISALIEDRLRIRSNAAAAWCRRGGVCGGRGCE